MDISWYLDAWKNLLKPHVQDAHAVELPVWDQCIQVMCDFFSESNDSFQSFKKSWSCLGVLTPDIKKSASHIPWCLTVGQGLDDPEKKILRKPGKSSQAAATWNSWKMRKSSPISEVQIPSIFRWIMLNFRLVGGFNRKNMKIKLDHFPRYRGENWKKMETTT